MMALALKKKKEDEERAKLGELKAPLELSSADRPDASSARPPGHILKLEEGVESATGRGRTIDKGKARVRVVGFDSDDADGQEDNEYVLPLYCCFLISEVFSLYVCVM